MSPQKIKQWKSGQDGLDKLYMEEADIPTPGEDEVLVEIHSVSLNYRDTEVCMGLYNHHKQVEQPPAVVPCSDMCGIVVAVGASSNNTTDPYKNPAFALK